MGGDNVLLRCKVILFYDPITKKMGNSATISNINKGAGNIGDTENDKDENGEN